MAEEHQVEKSPKISERAPGPFAFAFTGATAFGAMVAIMVLLSIYEKQPPPRVRSAPFCCPDVLHELFSAVNSTIDPCRSIFGHTCYALVTTRDDMPAPANLNTHPIDGFPKTEAGRAIAAYYRACAFSSENSISFGRSSAAVISAVVNPPKSVPISSHGLLALIVDLSLKYGLPSVIEFGISVTSNFETYLTISPTPLIDPAVNPLHIPLDTWKIDALATVNEALSLRVTLEEVEAMFRDHMILKQELIEKYTLDSMGELTHDVSLEEWKDLMGKYNVSDRDTVFSIPMSTVKEFFRSFFSPTRRPIAVVSVLVGASVKLASAVLIETNSNEKKIETCRIRSQDLRPLWILDQIQGLPTDPQDKAIKTAYNIVASAVLRKARSGMEANDFQELEKILREMSLLLPSQVVPSGLTIPIMTSIYTHAELVTRAYMLHARRHQMFTRTISNDSLEDLQKNYVTTAGTVMTIPTSVYSLIPLSEISDTMLLMSTVGVYMADSLWEFVFARNWSATTNAALQAYRVCLLKNSRSLIEWPSRLLWLGVQTSFEASKDTDWESAVDTGEVRNATRGQLFYMMLVRYVMCQAPHRRYPTFGQDVNVFMSGYEEFYHSFGCSVTASKITGAICSLRL